MIGTCAGPWVKGLALGTACLFALLALPNGTLRADAQGLGLDLRPGVTLQLGNAGTAPGGAWILHGPDGAVLNADFRTELMAALATAVSDTAVAQITVQPMRLASGAPKTLVLWASMPTVAVLLKLDVSGKVVGARPVADGYAFGELTSFRWKGVNHDYAGFVTAAAGSADFSHWVFWDWSSAEPKVVFSADAGMNEELPNFRDLDGDGTDELVFDNRGSKYGRPPQLFRWAASKGTFEPADRAFPDFWNRRISAAVERLRAWRVSKTARADRPRLPLVLVDALLQDFDCRGGREGWDAFVQKAEASLKPLMEDRSNDYLQRRASGLERRVRRPVTEDGPDPAGRSI